MYNNRIILMVLFVLEIILIKMKIFKNNINKCNILEKCKNERKCV